MRRYLEGIGELDGGFLRQLKSKYDVGGVQQREEVERIIHFYVSELDLGDLVGLFRAIGEARLWPINRIRAYEQSVFDFIYVNLEELGDEFILEVGGSFDAGEFASAYVRDFIS